MYDVTKLPAVRALIEQPAQPDQATVPAPAIEYARAPQASGAPVGSGRPPAIQETIR